jgi:hypothetical protein
VLQAYRISHAINNDCYDLIFKGVIQRIARQIKNNNGIKIAKIKNEN